MKLEQVRERADVGVARRQVSGLAVDSGFDQMSADQLEIVVSEGATNFLRHAGGGDILYRLNREATPESLDVAFIDRGPGIQRVEKALEDGFSTVGGLGQGLGAMRRLSDIFDIYSLEGVGTTVTTRFFRTPGRDGEIAATDFLNISGFVYPVRGQQVCGDGWAVWSRPGRNRILLCDGLGHGEGAHEASRAATTAFTEAEDMPLPDLFTRIDNALEGTRGVVALALEFEQDSLPSISAIGIGNISGQMVAGDRTRHIVSLDGMLGRGSRQGKMFAYDDIDWRAVILGTDGIRMRWNLADYPGLLARTPLTIAATLWRDFNRGTDDSGIVVIKQKEK